MAKKETKKRKRDSVTKESYLIHGMARTKKWDYSHHVVPPLSASVTYRLESVERGNLGFEQFSKLHSQALKKGPTYLYDRLDEPTRSMLEDQLAFVEDGEVGFCFATGMAAISAAMCFDLKMGDEILIHKTLYGCTYSLSTNWLPRFGIKVKYLDFTNLKDFEENINPKVKFVYFETPANPTMEIVDMEAVVKIVEKENKKRKKADRIKTAVDNTFATPRCQRPLNWGIDMSINSLTKNIGGFGTDMGGAIVTSREYENDIMLYRKDFGGVLGSKNAWPILVYGLSTLVDRGKKQEATAIKVAKFLEGHPKIGTVAYPGLKSHPHHKIARKQMVDFDGNFAPGNMIYFSLKDDKEAKCNKLLNYIADNAYTITLAVSLGHIRTLIEKPGSLTHSMIPEEEQAEAKMAKSGVRLSIGLENADDILNDLDDALKKLR
ncbi:trans-sulfuration enzyme family protein [candidate division KSB1 bacterium]